MLMDAISCLIVLFSTIFYARKGFALTMISMFQGIACIVFGLLFCEDVGSFLKNKTGFGDYLTTSLTNAFSENVQESTFYKSIPDIFNNWVSDAANTTIRHTADAAASVITTIIGFLLIVLAVKLICFFFARIFSRENRRGPFALADSLVGMGLGVVLGIFYMLIFYTVIAALMHFIPEGLAKIINASLDNSAFSGKLYNNNFILMNIKNLFIRI